jgi:uncharacterized protein (TIGR03000 family)
MYQREPTKEVSMSQKVIWFAGTLACASAMLFLTGNPSQAAGHGGGGHGGGGFHGGGHGGGGFHGGGFHGGGWRGGHGWHDGGWRGHRGFYGGFYGGYYPGSYGLGNYPYYSYGYADYPYYAGGDSNYPSYGYSDSYYDPNYNASPPASGVAPEYGYAPPAAVDNTAHLTVRVPPDAQLWFQNTPTRQQGAVREFQSPQLTPGPDYTYDIRARWRQGDHDVDQTRHVTVHAGSHLTVDFAAPAADQRQAPSSAGTSGS